MLEEQGQAPASQAKTGDQQADSGLRPIEQQTEEEVEFNRLSGSAQERVQELATRARRAEEALDAERASRYIPPAPQQESAPDKEQALRTLEQAGVATQSTVDTKLSQAFNELRWDMENTRLNSKYTGEIGEPKYDRTEVEDYIRTHPQFKYYAPEDVFKFKMYPDEFSNVETKEVRRTSSSLRPTKAQVTSSTITPENVEEMVKAHDQQWYEEHIGEINAAAAAHTKQFTGVSFGQ